MKRAALVVMAAGMGSRYGGNKQIDGMGPHGEILMEYSIRDAIRAGFTKVVFIIKPEMEPLMRELCGDRFSKEVEICYAAQDFSSIPAEYAVPGDRIKPFGTVHAVMCAAPYVTEPFAVLNADDYYGVESFAQMYDFFTADHDGAQAAMMGYRLKNTVSRHGAVTRAICNVENGILTGARELKNIQMQADGSIADLTDPGAPEALDPDSLVSMNFWGFGPAIFDMMKREFTKFLMNIPEGDITAEYLLPVFVDQMLRAGKLSVNVIETGASWFGVTYKEDKPRVAAALKELHDKGIYS